ncbi:uncharacterized protein LOC117172110 [Belonocnema kinseyi]|uniref:uncharacterized protein LOC117172110 n=1 Tax=Belonocnema kinseyi TaxID=2817044 RepID=UPI00143DA5A1|nr:uncharacterized protein LOC117172110 [Belonocnema kinseyi]
MLISYGILSVLMWLINSTLSENRNYTSADSEFYEESLFKCTKQGFHPDPRNCSVFYRCVNWGHSRALTTFKFECGGGTVFSKNKGNICVPPNESERNDCNDSRNEINSIWQNSQHYSNSAVVPSSISSYLSGNGNDVTAHYHCSGEEFIEDPEDCRKFYRCVKEGSGNYVKYEFTCGTGTIWDQDTQVCNHPWAVSRKKCSKSFPELDINDTEDQWNGDPSTRHPPDASIIPEYSSYSVYLSQVNRPVYPSQPNQSVYLSQPDQPAYQSKPSQPTDFELARKYSYLGQINHPFYPIKAKNPSYPEEMNELTSDKVPGLSHASYTSSASTTAGTSVLPPRPIMSSSEIHEPFLTQSVTKTIIGSSETSETTKFLKASGSLPTQQESTSVSVSGTSKVENAHILCSEEGFFPDPKNCRKFYRCVDEGSKYTKYEFQCGSGTGWDLTLRTCNELYLLPNCDALSNTIGNNNKSDPSSSHANFSIKQKHEQSPSIIALNPAISTVSSNIISTIFGSKINKYASSTRLSFATASEKSYLHSTISSKYLPPNIVGSTTPSYKIASAMSSFPASSYLTSAQRPSQSPTQEITINTLTVRKQISSMTLSPTSSALSTESTTSRSTGCQEDGFFPNINNCKKFYRCIQDAAGFKRFDFDCGPGTAWDQGLQTCNYVSLVSLCKSTKSKIEEGSSIPSKPLISGVSEMLTTLNSNEVIESNESCDDRPKPPSDKQNCSPTKQNNIVCSASGFYAHPTRCNKFYRCVQQKNGFNVYYFDCPPGTIFDPSISVCNYPESVHPDRDCVLGQGTSCSESLTSEKPLTFPVDIQEIASTTKLPESTTLNEENSSSESTTLSETVGTSLETTDLQSENESTEMSTATSSEFGIQTEANTQTEVNSVTIESNLTTQLNEGGSTEISIWVTEQGSIDTETTSELSSFQKPTITTEAIQQTTENPTDSTEQIGSGIQGSTTQTLNMTSVSTPSLEPGIVSCPIAANLADEQVLLVCPTGFRRHPKFCNLLYQCTSEGNMEIKILTLSCPENTIFDEMKVQCLPEAESSQPCMGNKANARFYRRLGEHSISPVKLSTKSICPKEGHYPYQEGCSSAFYKCQHNSRGSLQGYLYKCPKDFVYWSISRRCEREIRLPMCIRLGSTTEKDFWDRRWEVPIEDSNLSARMLYFN